MKIEFTILCPEKKCSKCIAMEKLVEYLVHSYFPMAKIIRLSRPEEMARFNTWIVPSLFLNGHAIARGYIPDREKAVAIIQRILGDKILVHKSPLEN
ncbi:MAG: thioredoxin family protein [Bacteroidales bacterium]